MEGLPLSECRWRSCECGERTERRWVGGWEERRERKLILRCKITEKVQLIKKYPLIYTKLRDIRHLQILFSGSSLNKCFSQSFKQSSDTSFIVPNSILYLESPWRGPISLNTVFFFLFEFLIIILSLFFYLNQDREPQPHIPPSHTCSGHLLA